METSQGNSLYSYLKQKKNCHFSPFTKSDNRRTEQVLPGEEGVGISGRGEEVEKGCRRVNMVQILCAPVCKWKKETC
jgi:hypothetical protein